MDETKLLMCASVCAAMCATVYKRSLKAMAKEEKEKPYFDSLRTITVL